MAPVTDPVFLLTDFGSDEHYVGQVKAVVARIAPASPIFDITHSVEPFAIDEAAWILEITLPHLPHRCVALVVVDPGVGGAREAIALHDREGRRYVGPDNGVLAGALPPTLREGRRVDLSGSGVEARAITPISIGIDPALVRPTFHGRDLFAPAAAQLADGRSFETLGGLLNSVASLGRFETEERADGRLEARVIHVDRFGNLITTVPEQQLEGRRLARLSVGGVDVTRSAATFEAAPASEPFWHLDSSGFVAIAINRQSAAAALGVRRGDRVLVELA